MQVKKTIERDGRTFRIVQGHQQHFRILDDKDAVLDEFDLIQTTTGWDSFRSGPAADPAVERFAASFAAEVQRGEIEL